MASFPTTDEPASIGTAGVRRPLLVGGVLPVLVPLLLMAVSRIQRAAEPDWSIFLSETAWVLLAGIPLFVAHFFAFRMRSAKGIAIWLTVVIGGLIVIALPDFDGLTLELPEWIVVAMASAVSLAFELRGRTNVTGALRRMPLTLDGTLIAILALWVLAMTSLFGSTEDAVDNQPLTVFFDAGQLISNPFQTIGYFLQFGAIAALLFSLLWLCRYWLVRRILAQHGWPGFFFAAGLLWILAVPVIGSLVLLLPINSGEWTLLPSEDHNSFAGINYTIGFAISAIYTLFVLASERLLAERTDAMSRHAQARAEFEMLREQINPHFLFNTLNTLYALCLSDQRTSAQAVVKLSDLLRYSIYDAREPWVPLSGEVQQMRNYLDLQMLRFGNRCEVQAQWPQGGKELLIPPQAMIVLLENAFKHGVEALEGECEVRISLSLTGRRMRFVCENNHPGSEPSGEGIGLANLRRRLELLLGNSFTLESKRQDEAWFAQLELELKPC